jgi:hypothetical protein
MTRVARWLPLVAVAGAGAAWLAFALAGGDGHARNAQPRTTSSCAQRLLRDWSDGRIDGTYPVACYRTALRSMPTDLRVYSSAPEDIAQALQSRIVAGARRPAR